jgi:FkbM family methyltransferase
VSRTPGAGRPLRARTCEAVGRLLTPLLWALADPRPIEPFPGYTFGATARSDWRYRSRFSLWRVARRLAPGQVPVRVPWIDGLRMTQYLGNDTSLALYVGGCFEPNELAFLTETLDRGMTFVDVGANEGVFSLLAAQRVGPAGRVLAVEPSDREMERLRRGVVMNGLGGVVTCVQTALGETSGRAVLHVANSEHAGHNTLGAFVYASVSNRGDEPVRVMTLDDLVGKHELDRIDLVKIDVEGAELQVLRGAVRVLEEMRPMLLLEVQEASLLAQGATTADLFGLLRAHGYDLFEFGPDGRRRPVDGFPSSLNIVAQPRRAAVPR